MGRTPLFAVIHGAQREPGIQWYLRDARLDPGSALRAVRDDVKRRRGRAIRGGFAFLLSSPRRRGSSGTCGIPAWIPARPCAPSGMTREKTAPSETN